MNSQTPLGEKGSDNKPHIETERKTTQISGQSFDTLDKPDQPHEMPDTDWLAMSNDWQSQPFAKADIEVLLKRTRRRTYWAKSCLALNIIATISILAGFIYGLLHDEFGEPVNSYLGICGLLSIVFVYYELKIRLTTWQQCCDSPDKAISNAIAGCESSIKYFVLTKVSFIPFLAVINWFLFTIDGESEKTTWPPIIFVNSFMLIAYCVTEFLLRKRRAELKKLQLIKSK